jgi:hypothetical protein
LTVLLSLDHRLDELPVATFFLLLLFLEREGERERAGKEEFGHQEVVTGIFTLHEIGIQFIRRFDYIRRYLNR